MASRTRDRQPLLPILSQYVNDRWHRLRTLLDAALKVENGEEFTAEGVTWLRVSSKDQRHNRPPVRAVNPATGELVHVSRDEGYAFWQWAIVETLRLAGLRAEELIELTHLSVRQYQRPNGEVVALLVVTPSKSDRERVIPISAELFHVVAQVIRRHRNEHGTVPVCVRYDSHERTWSEPLPYLFQNFYGGTQRGMASITVWRLIGRACDELALTKPQFKDIRFAPHDFRRFFATAHPHRGRTARTSRHPHHPRLRRGLRRGRHQPLPAVPRPPPGGTAANGVPGAHPRGVDGLPGPLRQAPRRTRLLRAPLRDSLPARTRLHPLPDADHQPEDAVPPGRTGGGPPRSP
ncbi:tyrosine-type recombinase/integrase [Streptomyces sioyaensis]|uniref:tyrosine-type recombinase/integrase n=1 Tax=Streptomyces sioyaensis TaxID=67364 RepID=UPI0036E07655